MIEIDAATDARLSEMAARRGGEVGVVIAEAIELLDCADIDGLDISEDRRRLDAFRSSRAAVPLDDVRAWTESWGTSEEKPRPEPRKVG